jgi:hypothetical protein
VGAWGLGRGAGAAGASSKVFNPAGAGLAVVRLGASTNQTISHAGHLI